MKKKFAFLLLLCLFYASIASGAVRNATSDIPLNNRYYYRLAERSLSISPSSYYTDNFKPASVREAEVLFNSSDEMQELFGIDDNTKQLGESASKYYDTDEFFGRGFKFIPVREIHLKSRYTSEEATRITGDFGEDNEKHFFNRASLSGSIYLNRFIMGDYTLSVHNNTEKTKVEFERAKVKFATKHVAYVGALDNLQIGPGFFGQLTVSDNISPQKFAMIKTEIPYDWGVLGKFRYYIFNFWFDDNDRKNKDPMLIGMRFSLKPASWAEIAIVRTSFYGGSKHPSYGFSDYWDLLTASKENSGDKHDSDQFTGAELSIYLPFLKNFSFFKGGKIYAEYNWNDVVAPWQEEDKGKKFKLLGESRIFGIFLTTGKTDIRVEYASISLLTYDHHLYAPEGYTIDNYLIGHQIGRNSTGTFFEIYTELTDNFHPYVRASFIKKGKRESATKQYEEQYSIGAVTFIKKNFELETFMRLIMQNKENISPHVLKYDYSGKKIRNYLGGFDLKYYF